MLEHFCRSTLACAVAGASLLIAPGANSQESGAPAKKFGVLEEVMVSAQRREEGLQEVPLSITALSQELLQSARIDSSRDLGLVTPGLLIDAVGAWVQPAIRGVTTVITGTTEANVATYIDGVYQASQIGAFYEMPDVRQVEVLKGPQGTLFGRNSTGGAILIHTLDPELQQMSGLASVSYSSFDTTTAKAYISAPLIEERLAFSLSGYYDKMSRGYLDDRWKGGRTGETETTLVRGKLRLVPWEGADFTLAAMHTDREDGTGLANTNWRGHNAQATRAALEGIPLADEPHEVTSDVDTMVNPELTSISLTGSIELGPGTLSTTTAYLENDQWMVIDGDGSPYQLSRSIVDSDYEVFSQELIYSTNQFERVRAIGGLYYYTKNAFQLYASTTLDNAGNWTNDDLALGIWTDDKIEAYAAFGEVTYDLTDRLAVTAGLRYSYERATAYAAMVLNADEKPEVPELGSETWESIDPRLSLTYALSPDMNLYFTYSQGFKSGIFNNSGLQTKPVDPEEVDAYEVGFKGQLGPGIVLTAAAFYYDYTDLQQQIIEYDPVLNLLKQQFSNAANAEIKGVEVSATWPVTANFHLTVGAQYLDAEFEDFPGALVNIPESPSVIVPTLIDASGNSMIRAPEWTGTITALYNLETTAGDFVFSGTLFGSSEYHLDAASRVTQPGHAKVNASVAWQPTGSRLELALWGKNLTDSDTLASLISSTAYDAVTYAPPRSYGVEASYRF